MANEVDLTYMDLVLIIFNVKIFVISGLVYTCQVNNRRM